MKPKTADYHFKAINKSTTVTYFTGYTTIYPNIHYTFNSKTI